MTEYGRDISVDNSTKHYRAIAFDLDGTLLSMDIDDLMKDYFAALGAYMAPLGVDPKKFVPAMKAGIDAMARHTDGSPNSAAFWKAFNEVANTYDLNLHNRVEDFYENHFGKLLKHKVVNQHSVNIVRILKDKGYPLMLCTMPMFPRRAVEWRLNWAGLNPDDFERITDFDNSTSIKPTPHYFAENLAAANLAGSEILMVGNHTFEDLDCKRMGIDAYLVTDMLINKNDFDINNVKHGLLADLETWVKALPECKNPATDIQTGLIDSKSTETFMNANLIG